jgi:hypothetical protein
MLVSTISFVHTLDEQQTVNRCCNTACYRNSFTLSIRYDTDRIENKASNSSSNAVCVFVPAGTCSPNRCLVTAISYVFAIPAYYVGTDRKVIS